MDDYERVLLVKNDVYIYKIPPRSTNRAYRAADWNLDAPDFVGRMRLVTKAGDCILKLEDKNSGDLFGQCPVDKHPGLAVEAVSDSSRYFVIRLQDQGRNAFIGMGFRDRSDSFDLNVALQDHFKYAQKEEQLAKAEVEAESAPALDLGLKQGETIKINCSFASKRAKPKASVVGGGVLLPPPGGIKLPPPSARPQVPSAETSPVHTATVQPMQTAPPGGACNNVDLLLGIGASPGAAPGWGDFKSSREENQSSSLNANAASWEQF